MLLKKCARFTKIHIFKHSFTTNLVVSVILCNKDLTVSEVHNWKKKKTNPESAYSTLIWKNVILTLQKQKLHLMPCAKAGTWYSYSQGQVSAAEEQQQDFCHNSKSHVFNLQDLTSKWFCVGTSGDMNFTWCKNSSVSQKKKSQIIVWSWIRKKKGHKTFTLTVLYKLSLITGSLGTLLLVPSWKKGTTI